MIIMMTQNILDTDDKLANNIHLSMHGLRTITNSFHNPLSA